ncbi:uncharacterized protein LOC111069209 [Drosophila obscura]|uniref:uncharacterized protein LOC111069209 n=1 Tax=Drosophila obscura TaxID=7282 RepID=UPI000BA0F97B|nr:uncharacterized protein LOC111069209 [Drosophila obscura]
MTRALAGVTVYGVVVTAATLDVAVIVNCYSEAPLPPQHLPLGPTKKTFRNDAERGKGGETYAARHIQQHSDSGLSGAATIDEGIGDMRRLRGYGYRCCCRSIEVKSSEVIAGAAEKPLCPAGMDWMLRTRVTLRRHTDTGCPKTHTILPINTP